MEELQKLLDEATASYKKLTEDFSKQATEINAEIEAKQVTFRLTLRRLRPSSAFVKEHAMKYHLNGYCLLVQPFFALS